MKDVRPRSGFEAGYRYQVKKWNAGTVNLFLSISLAVLLVAGINIANLRGFSNRLIFLSLLFPLIIVPTK